MESLDHIRETHIRTLVEELQETGVKLMELGWSREDVMGYVHRLLDEATGEQGEQR